MRSARSMVVAGTRAHGVRPERLSPPQWSSICPVFPVAAETALSWTEQRTFPGARNRTSPGCCRVRKQTWPERSSAF